MAKKLHLKWRNEAAIEELCTLRDLYPAGKHSRVKLPDGLYDSRVIEQGVILNSRWNPMIGRSLDAVAVVTQLDVALLLDIGVGKTFLKIGYNDYKLSEASIYRFVDKLESLLSAARSDFIKTNKNNLLLNLTAAEMLGILMSEPKPSPVNTSIRKPLRPMPVVG